MAVRPWIVPDEVWELIAALLPRRPGRLRGSGRKRRGCAGSSGAISSQSSSGTIHGRAAIGTPLDATPVAREVGRHDGPTCILKRVLSLNSKVRGPVSTLTRRIILV